MQEKRRNFLYTLLITFIGQSIVVVILLLLGFSTGILGTGGQITGLQQEIRQLKKQVEQSGQRSYVNSHQLPVPVVFCGDTLDTDNVMIRERLEREFYLLLNEQAQIQLYLKRSARYLPMIENYLKEAQLPDDLKYIAVHESALLPHVRSRANAVGLWQFIRATGRLYDLKINSYIDERREVERSTAAAMWMFRDLKNILGDWPLVLAAYNAGLGRVSKAMEQQRTHSFFELALPEETERYFFKIVAAGIVLSQPEKFGFYVENNDFFYNDSLENISYVVGLKMISVQELAGYFGLTAARLKTYNPQLINSHVPTGVINLKIPRSNYLLYEQNPDRVDEYISGYIRQADKSLDGLD
jgi:membrane-bound lytic murein transglycosylase D